jgi:isopenicillin-N epimerase
MCSTFAKHWPLAHDVDHLNHGSFGACPAAVLDIQNELRQEMESQPMRFLWRELPGRLAKARKALAQFVGTSVGDIALVPNATTGVNAVLRSLTFQPGDELIITNHEYNACRNALHFVADRSGAKVVVVNVPFPLTSSSQVTQCILDHVTPRTRLALIDHVTSPTALVLPIADIVAALTQHNVDTLVDGAHAPGMVLLNLQTIGAAYYTGNCHKWLCTPKGAGFLYVRQDKQHAIRPTVISHGANAPTDQATRFRLEFDWTGTCDPTACLCIAPAIEYLSSLLPGGWDELMMHNRQMAIDARDTICDVLDVVPPCPDEMIGSIAAVPLPWDAPEAGCWFPGSLPLQDELLNRFDIEVPIIPFPAVPKQLVRISAQLYNSPPQYQRLAQAIKQIGAKGPRGQGVQ